MIRDYSLPMPELPGRVDWPLLEAAWHSLQQTINIGPPREDGKEAVIAEDQSMDRPAMASTESLVICSTIQSNLPPTSENAAHPQPLIITRPDDISGSKSPITSMADPAGPTVYSTTTNTSLDSRCHRSNAAMACSNERTKGCIIQSPSSHSVFQQRRTA